MSDLMSEASKSENILLLDYKSRRAGHPEEQDIQKSRITNPEEQDIQKSSNQK